MEQLYFATRAAWRQWLKENHDQESGVWLVFYKKGTGQPSVSYDEAVEEALCFGWIDSIVKSMDQMRYMQKFTPRNDHSNWSAKNKERVMRMISAGLMTNAGLAKVESAKERGQWDAAAERPVISDELPDELATALRLNAAAQERFEQLSPSHRQRYITWIAMAKKPRTRQKRVAEAITLLEKGEKLGLK